MTSFRVYWSKRGHYTASSKAGAMPGTGNGEIESTGETTGEAVKNLHLALIQRRAALQSKIEEVDEAIYQVTRNGWKAEDLLLLPKKGKYMTWKQLIKM